jgi:protein tyrosine/serine phosphatase
VLWLAGLSGCGLGELDDYAPLTLTDNFRVIEPGRAYRSAQLDAESLKLVVREYGIRTIINLRGENPTHLWYQRERAAADELGVAHVDVRMSAHALPPRETLLLLYDTFCSAEHPVLIHCKAGADRSGAGAAIWRMVVNGESRAAAARELSPLYGHFASETPEMDQLVAMFEPSRAWIETDYPVP